MLGLICMVMLAYLWHQNIVPFVGDVGGDGRDGGQRDGVGFQGPGQAHGPPVQVLHVQDGWLIWSSNIKQTYNYRLFLDTVQRRLTCNLSFHIVTQVKWSTTTLMMLKKKL